jgi:hypothetical protein
MGSSASVITKEEIESNCKSQAEEIKIFVDQNPNARLAGRSMQPDFELLLSSLNYPCLVMKHTQLEIENYFSDAGRVCTVEPHLTGSPIKYHEDGWILRIKKKESRTPETQTTTTK